ncbi:MAG: aminoacyl-tRNA hydrolase [bacterium]
MYYIVGLGNPGEEYADTRHNAGRIAVEFFAKANSLPSFVSNKKAVGMISEGQIKKEKIMAILPDTFMNKSGASVKPFITSVKKAESLIVVHDDLDMPLGKIKLLFNRGSGGHKGVESVRKAVKTDAFIRIKMGVSPVGAKGKAKRPDADKIMDFIVGKFKKPEFDLIKKASKLVAEAIEMIILESKEKAMSEFNQG